MLDNFREDLKLAKRHSSSGTLKLLLLSQGLWAISVYRFGRRAQKVRVPLIGQLLRLIHTVLFKYIEIVTSISLPRDAEIAAPLAIGHFGPIVINQGVKIGAHCTLMQGVTVGAHYRRMEVRIPEIGEHVYIGAHAIILGDVEIGDYARIGAGAVVTKSVPYGMVVTGNPAKILKRSSTAPPEGFPPDDETDAPGEADA